MCGILRLMRGRDGIDSELAEFVHARTAELHRTAYLLTADQDRAERLVEHAVAELRHDGASLGQAGTMARLHMARLAARATAPSDAPSTPDEPLPTALAGLTPRQRAALLLQVVERYDARSTARSLGIGTRAVEEAEAEAGRALGISTDGEECRTSLIDFAEQATWPDPATTLGRVERIAHARRRPWWTYVAALLVIVFTATCIVVTQRWHTEWLSTPDGLNHTHGTHFPTYTDGYKLLTIREARPGIVQNLPTGGAGAVALPCDTVSSQVRLSVLSSLSAAYYQARCAHSRTKPMLTPVTGKASATVLGGEKDSYPLGVYEKIPRSEYPVATSDFVVQHDVTLNDVRREVAQSGKQASGNARGEVLTLHGTDAHPNGTFKGRLVLPSGSTDDEFDAVGLLSPTTTGRFQVRVDGVPPTTSCSDEFPAGHDDPGYRAACSLVDRHVPQVKFRQSAIAADGGESVPVEITVKDARGPWTLQVAADRYLLGTGLNY